MLDHQRRDDDTGFQQNGDTGKRVHGVLGWDKVAPESMAMYQSGPGYYRVASKPEAEARMWMIAGIAGGIQTWWHVVGAYHDDRRIYRTPEAVTTWWANNQRYLVDRTPVANVGVIWSQQNTDFFEHPEKAIPVYTAAALAGKPLPVYGDGSNRREWLYVGDFARAVRIAMEPVEPGETYNIGGGHELANLELAKRICALAGAPESLIAFVEDRPGHDFRYAHGVGPAEGRSDGSRRRRSTRGWPRRSNGSARTRTG